MKRNTSKKRAFLYNLTSYKRNSRWFGQMSPPPIYRQPTPPQREVSRFRILMSILDRSYNMFIWIQSS